EQFDSFISTQKAEPSRHQLRSLLFLKGRCYNALGDYKESAKIWQQLSESKFEAALSAVKSRESESGFTPSPLMSTP
ncbi:MAG: hypothetical protein KDD53_09805, partial [Bdellovibrionales bacterium]|nr:hypothetical protein [Bdellovibrionales bacterium]